MFQTPITRYQPRASNEKQVQPEEKPDLLDNSLFDREGTLIPLGNQLYKSLLETVAL